MNCNFFIAVKEKLIFGGGTELTRCWALDIQFLKAKGREWERGVNIRQP
jgi:hypothetical protein